MVQAFVVVLSVIWSQTPSTPAPSLNVTARTGLKRVTTRCLIGFSQMPYLIFYEKHIFQYSIFDSLRKPHFQIFHSCFFTKTPFPKSNIWFFMKNTFSKIPNLIIFFMQKHIFTHFIICFLRKHIFKYSMFSPFPIEAWGTSRTQCAVSVTWGVSRRRPVQKRTACAVTSTLWPRRLSYGPQDSRIYCALARRTDTQGSQVNWS